MPPDLEINIIPYYPHGVRNIIASSFDCLLGQVDEDTVLKYSHRENPDSQQQTRLNIEAQIYTILGDHDRIIKFKGGDGRGIRLEYATKSVAQYLKQSKTRPTTSQRIKWAKQAAEGIAYIHKSSILHCDTNVNNLLLDKNLNLKFADFQGRYLAPDGTVLLDGLSSENVKSSLPRPDPDYADQKTDIFALGSAIYYIMTGHEPFPELNPFDDDDEAEIMARYKSGRFPSLDGHFGGGGRIVHKCWMGAYESASEAEFELQELMKTALRYVECKTECALVFSRPANVDHQFLFIT